ncbi:N-acetylmuramate alpha-1-phosphate uridylyltransferase MurU [Aliidiomarina indica]|uniref:N-acetylmuramate alpha-1-phosphate uridylyltransferase MurU n=1 Tax=Aliidiomarina indica TaxID=2749147 RepID=UPI001890036D|nr:nucleotidyltransferase family protein [Aliidiomarina indica]
MRAMILAAGRGTRMRPLTDNMPKPLLKVAGKPLLEWHLQKLVAAGMHEIVINTAWLGEQLESYFGDGSRWGAQILWSHEPEGGLETAGGIIQALPLLQEGAPDQPFAVINGDIFTDYDFTQLPTTLQSKLGHLVLVENPEHHPQGDFDLSSGYLIDQPRYTFSGISVLSPQLFAGAAPGFHKLRPFFTRAMTNQKLTGELYHGVWTDVGTPQRLTQLNQELS